MDHGASSEFVNLDKLDGFDYSSWVGRMKFLLSSLNVYYVLDPNLIPIPQDPTGKEANDEIEKRRMLRKEDEDLCYKYIKNSLSDRLCNLYALGSSKNPRLLWETLEMRFKDKEPKTNKNLVRKYLDFRVVDGKSVTEQVHELQDLVKTLEADSVFLPEAFQIVAIMDKLPSSWRMFFKRILMNKSDKHGVSAKKTPVGDGPSTTKLAVKRKINFKKTAPLKLHRNVGHRKPQHMKLGSNDLNALDVELADLVAHVNLSM
uniref:uncharacterized protein LOC122594515 n=1 Tax=Erigeron canadensis TaxID=72917 RepID=UPI001CB8ACA2|nr:uncharacterized protein LOC122594515 [Erigeron canadensis]